jgi:hypothetical protein
MVTVFRQSQLGHHVGERITDDIWSTVVGTHPPGWASYGPYQTVPESPGIAAFCFMVDNTTANNDPIASIDVVSTTSRGSIQTHAHKQIFRTDFNRPWDYQVFGLAFDNLGTPLEFRVFWHGKSFLQMRELIIIGSQAGGSVVQPLYGAPLRPLEWTQLKRPTQLWKVWIDPLFSGIPDAHGVPMVYNFFEMLWNIGRVCGLGFQWVANPSEADFRFHYGSSAEVISLSKQWNGGDWFPGTGYGSAYIAVHPNKRAIWIGTQTKPSQGGNRIGRINAMRFLQHGLMVALGWPYHDGSAPIFAARNANMSGDFRYPANEQNIKHVGLAGFDGIEVAWWRKHFGNPWLYCFETGI